MKKHKKLLIVIAGLIVAFVVGTIIVNNQNKERNKIRAIKPEYELYTVNDVPPLSMTGKIIADRTQALNSPAGKLDQLNVKDGQTVKSGDVLLTVTDTATQEAISNQKDVISKANKALNSANSALRSAQQSYNQADSEAKAGMKEEVNKAQEEVNDANSNLQDENNKLTDLQNKLHVNLTAPFDGIISIDSSSKDGAPALTINSTKKVLQASVSEYDYAKIQPGYEVTVTGIDGTPNQKVKITKVNQVPSNQGKGIAYYSFAADVSNDFLYGQSVKLKVAQKGLKIPEGAVYKGNIYKVINGKVRVTKADVTRKGDIYIVNYGVAKGEKIILNPDSKLKDGGTFHD
ncbi:efflux RND transporter periplasmic adaptor subunit [Xylocopilactobacillus apis]|uniref:RND transporter MFP subunit n=1 Tax=Xylocopilactobacillus apis TaxID=2932183 RepID=A0AAU9CNU0_9LACO|nr:HlyD family efflux transporter periplasmic adaptor subunit [Xylocopilactobacillus apis]BDR55604.1 RND transporter MFP subunit [Xylocopilactobacillus apis]